MHTRIIGFSATQPNTGAAATAFTGDSLTIENNSPGGRVAIVGLWAFNQVEGFHQVAFPSGHDTTRGFRYVVEANAITTRNIMGVPLRVMPQELLSITIAGSNTAGDVECGFALLHYSNLPGVDARHIGWDELLRRGEDQTTIQASITATAAGWSGSELITADSDLLKANTDYAVVGISTSTPCGAIALRGPDTGNVRTGVPGDALNSEIAAGFFGMLARAYNKPLIPIINSGNRANTFLDVGTNENAGATVVSAYLVELAKGGGRGDAT